MSPASARGQRDRQLASPYADLEAIDVLVADDGMSESEARSLMTAAGIDVLRV